MNKFKRINVIVLDSVGIGQMPDCEHYGDSGVNTLGNISEYYGLEVPNLAKMGLGNINYLKTVIPSSKPMANYTKMKEVGDGKDTLTGHWEMMGITLEKGFKQYIDNGFPEEMIEEFTRRTGHEILANKEANGMKVIKEYYNEHIETKKLIVYTSVDSTFQIAAHEDVIDIDELYRVCEIAREICDDPKYNVARVIARPFVGGYEDFSRTSNRHDYAVKPTKKIVMEKLIESNYDSVAIGKIRDVFSGVGVSEAIHTENNMDGVDKNIEVLKRDDINGFIFTNLVEFDSLYGHPRNPEGYRDALQEFDARLPEIIENLNDDDLLIITADHGNDPTYKNNDHTREYVPLLCYSPSLEGNNDLKIRNTFEDLGETICDNFGLESTTNGKSFLGELK